MSNVAENHLKLFSIVGFLLLFFLCTFQNVDSTESKEEEQAQLQPMYNLWEELERAKKLVKDGDHETALDLLSKLLLGCETVLGVEHPLTVEMLMLLETAYFNAKKYDEAAKAAWEIYKLQKKIHGEEDESTGLALLQLGYTYLTMKKYGKAEGALKKAYRVLKSKLGQNDSKTVDALFQLANLYRKMEDPEKLNLALRYYRKVHRVRSQTPQKGEEHEDTLEALKYIGIVLGIQNKVDEAVQVFQNAVAMETKILGADHPRTLEVKTFLFRTLTRAGKTGEAKKVLGKEDQDIDQDEDAIFALVEGKVTALVKKEKYDTALEILTEFYHQEMLKSSFSLKIFRVLGRLIYFSRFYGELDTALKWAHEMIDLTKVTGQGQKVPTAEVGVDMISLHLDAIASCVYVYAQKKDEQNLDLHVRKIVEVMKGQKVTDTLVHPLLSTVKDVVNFKVQLGKKDEAIEILRDFVDQIDRPRWGTVSLFCLSLMTEISQQNPDYYREIYSVAQKLWTTPRNPENDLQVIHGVDQMILEKANQLFEQELYETAFGLYKVLDLILPTNWTEDDELAPVFLRRIIKSAFIIKKSDQVLFYMRKNVHALKNKLATETEPEMDLDEREKIIQEIEKLQAFQEQIKIAAEIPKDVEQYINSRDFFWPKSKSKENQDMREKTEL